MTLESISLPYGEEKLQAFKDTKTGNISLPENIKQVGLLHLSNIRPGQSRTINLKTNGIDYPVLLSSVLATSNASERREIKFDISLIDKNDENEFVFEVTGQNNKSLSYIFPLNTIVYPTDNLIIKSQYNIEKVIISMQRVVTFLDVKELITIDISPIQES